MARAKDELLDQLHAITAERLADIIKNGIPVMDADGNVTERHPATAAYIAAAIKFLKDNDITADRDAGRFDPLKSAMADVPVFDEDSDPEEIPRYN